MFIAARISYIRFFTAVHIYDFHISTIIILITNLQGNVKQQEGRINNQILGVKGLRSFMLNTINPIRMFADCEGCVTTLRRQDNDVVVDNSGYNNN